MNQENGQIDVRYEPHEKPAIPLTIGLGVQMAILVVAGIILTPTVIIRAGGGSEEFLIWAVFAALSVSGITTVIQVLRIGPIGAGYILVMGTSGAFIAVCVTAIAEGGPAMLATLVVLSSLMQFLLAARLSLLRRILTPTVTGTVIMLIPVTIMPIVFNMLVDVPDGTPGFAAPLCTIVTLGVIVAIAFGSKTVLRLWAPIIGIVVGCIVAAMFGLYDVSGIRSSNFIGIPATGWPGFSFDFGPTFWTLLLAFIFVTYIGAMETIGDAVAVQAVARRKPQATDYSAVQGAVMADGTGNLLSGLAGTIPNTTYSSSISIAELTGVASRRVGVCVGIVLIVLAFFPKFTAAVIAVPGPVVAAYVLVIVALLFTAGMRLVVRDGLDYRKGIIAGTSFWIGVGFQEGVIFPDLLNPWLAALLENGMTAGGLSAVILTGFMTLLSSRGARLRTTLRAGEVAEFLRKQGRRFGWNEQEINRLCLAGDEAVISLDETSLQPDGPDRGLLVKVRNERNAISLELITFGGDANIEDRITLLDAQQSVRLAEDEISLRLLRHFATGVRHQQFRDADILTMSVEKSASRPNSII